MKVERAPLRIVIFFQNFVSPEKNQLFAIFLSFIALDLVRKEPNIILMKSQLSILSSKLLELHKELLNFQTQLVEAADGRKYASFDLWNLTTQDPRFAWLRALSSLIVDIDTSVSAKDPAKAATPDSLLQRAKDLFNTTDSDFARNYSTALQANPYLTIYDVDIRKVLQEVH